MSGLTKVSAVLNFKVHFFQHACRTAELISVLVLKTPLHSESLHPLRILKALCVFK